MSDVVSFPMNKLNLDLWYPYILNQKMNGNTVSFCYYFVLRFLNIKTKWVLQDNE